MATRRTRRYERPRGDERGRDERIKGQAARVQRRTTIRPASADPGPATARVVAKSRPAARKASGGRVTAQQLNRMSDAARWAYVGKFGRPRPPEGMVWAEDHSLVKKSFYSKTDTRKV